MRPPQSKRHPMAGLWKADYGPGGIQIILVNYDFTGPAARIVAIKVSNHLRTNSKDVEDSTPPCLQQGLSQRLSMVILLCDILPARQRHW